MWKQHFIYITLYKKLLILRKEQSYYCCLRGSGAQPCATSSAQGCRASQETACHTSWTLFSQEVSFYVTESAMILEKKIRHPAKNKACFIGGQYSRQKNMIIPRYFGKSVCLCIRQETGRRVHTQ